MLRSRGAQHVGALAVEEDVGAQVDVELHVEPLGLDLADGGADAQPGVVDQHVQPSVGVPVALDDRLDRVLLGQIRRHRLDGDAGGAQLLGGGLELLRPPRGDGQVVALLGEHLGDRQSDPARGARHDRRAFCHAVSSSSSLAFGARPA